MRSIPQLPSDLVHKRSTVHLAGGLEAPHDVRGEESGVREVVVLCKKNPH